jgi:hypothetical protein
LASTPPRPSRRECRRRPPPCAVAGAPPDPATTAQRTVVSPIPLLCRLLPWPGPTSPPASPPVAAEGMVVNPRA